MQDPDAEFKIRQKIGSYENYRGYGEDEVTKLPSKQAAMELLAFLDNRLTGKPLPHPQVDSDGEVVVYWDFREIQVFAEIGLDGDSTYAYLTGRGSAC